MSEPRTLLRAERLTFFSDAVAAIALTLLVLPLIDLVPEAIKSNEPPREVITENLVPLGSFVLSFFVIWRIWTVHHQLFDGVETVDRRVIRINSLWLLCVLILPFPAELVGAYGDRPLVIALYIGVLLACGLTLLALALALRKADPETAPDRAAVEPLAGNAVSLTIALVLVLVVPGAGYWPLLLLLIDGRVLALARRRRAQPASSRL